ncbi:MAG: hypothetical protein GXP25_23895 [Planctomycetes bacterium]|nr:hypothetical protein [Planctomycetota bacterium]
MRRVWSAVIVGVVVWVGVVAADPSLTIYNQNFAVVRDTIPLDLRQGVNRLKFTETTAHLEPDSVILRDPTGKRALQILEQNYRADPISQALLLSLYEGKTIEFQIGVGENAKIVKGKIVRSGYVPHQTGLRRYGSQYYQRQMAYARGASGQPIIEVNGKLRFQLPGTPLFPALGDDTILKPTLQWVIETDHAGKFDAELCYVTGGMSWEADYNVVSPEKSDILDIVGWVTMDNQSGKVFKNAKIKLMAGDVSKIQPGAQYGGGLLRSRMADKAMMPPVSEKAFDEYHLYTLARRTTLRDRETKQVEFVRASGVTSQRLYVYDGAKINWNRYRGWSADSIRRNREYGTVCNPKVWVMREFKNTKENHLGIALPRGRVRFYRRDADGQLEFTGENIIDHTPRDEKVRVYTGNAFDIIGERRQTNYKIDTARCWLDESFEITVRNHKAENVEVRVVEHLYRWINWEITEKSHEFTKTDARTAEFRIQIPPDGIETVIYTVHYTW